MMTNREKVVNGLEYHLKELSMGKICYECPYFGDDPCEIQLIANALELLKEPVEPVPEHPVVINTLACGECHAQVARWDTVRGKRVYLFRAKYCPECGRKVKWSDEDRPD